LSRDGFSRTHPVDPLAVLVWALAPDEGLHRPLDDRAPAEVPLVILDAVLELARRLGRRLAGRNGSRIDRAVGLGRGGRGLARRDGFTEEAFTADEALTKIGPVAGRVKGVPPRGGRTKRSVKKG
jgi:hypothetical protein